MIDRGAGLYMEARGNASRFALGGAERGCPEIGDGGRAAALHVRSQRPSTLGTEPASTSRGRLPVERARQKSYGMRDQVEGGCGYQSRRGRSELGPDRSTYTAAHEKIDKNRVDPYRSKAGGIPL